MRKIIKDSSIYSASNILVSVISIFLVPLYTRVFIPADYGIIDILNIVASLLNITISLEISQAVGRFTTDKENKYEKSAYFSTALFFSILAYSIFTIIAIVNSEYLSQLILDSRELSKITTVAFLSIWANGLFYLIKGQLRWNSRPFKYGIISLLYSLISILITVLLVLIIKIGIIGIFYGQFIAGFIGSLLSLYYIKDSFVFIFDSKKLIKMLKFSIPLVPSSVGVFLFVYVDRIIIKQLMTFNDIGLYGIGYKMASIMSLLIGGTQMALTPIIYNHYNEKNTPFEIARLARYFVLFAFIMILGMSLFAKEILMVLTTPIYYGAAEVVPFLVFSMFLSGVYVFAPGLWIIKKTKIIALINIGAAVLNTILNYLLIPILGIKGAAIATLTGAFITFYTNQTLSQKYYPIKYPWEKIIHSLCIILLILSLNSVFSNIPYYKSIILKIFLMFTGTFGIIYILMNKNEYLKIRKEIKNLSNSVPKFL
ncbi:lipopolysaccharide biosynthesis protein [Methanosarcina sp. T3]|uniref:lipopolysaccharide biosynthesis protein n=1 Tax=Methanosarcina sp. T3 TaxID=3439062 RepID=UPI003F86960E